MFQIDQPMDLIHYPNDHPGIISLSIRDDCFSNPSRNQILLESLARHSKSLTYLSTDILTFSLCNCNVHWELLSQCTKLRQLVLSSSHSYCVSSQAIENLPMIAHLSSSLTLVITDLIAFESCIWHCRQSRNPLIHDLAGRIVYEAPKGLGYDERSGD
ncbi:hypothetical protein F5887DRAFT_969053 [Amanita rubescens]|nr:hypothetical protein F5887DRAFT_969053 [Amanita rubescens]